MFISTYISVAKSAYFQVFNAYQIGHTSRNYLGGSAETDQARMIWSKHYWSKTSDADIVESASQFVDILNLSASKQEVSFYLKNLIIPDTCYSDGSVIMAVAQKAQKEHPEFVDSYGEIEPDFPDKTINSKTILGVDANKNSVRDDIDVWVNRTALNRNEAKAMRQYAKAKQYWLNTCKKHNSNDAKIM